MAFRVKIQILALAYLLDAFHKGIQLVVFRFGSFFKPCLAPSFIGFFSPRHRSLFKLVSFNNRWYIEDLFQTVVPLQNNERPFLSYLKPLFQSEAKCETINMNMIFNSHVNLTHFHIKGFTLSLPSKYRVLGTGNSLFNWWNKSLLSSILCEVAPVPSHNIQPLHFFHFIKGA